MCSWLNVDLGVRIMLPFNRGAIRDVTMSQAYCPPPHTVPNIIYSDAALLIVEKSSGLLSVPGRGPQKADCLLSRTCEIFADARIVHRLDMETSGLMVMARTREAHRALSIQFEKRKVRKEYIARVTGHPGARTGEIDLPLINDWPNRPLQKVDHAQGKPALTRWEILAQEQEASRLLLKPVTGRSHQLRVHLNAIGHPILGDTLYGTVMSKAGAARLQLHASLLGVQHPSSGEAMQFESASPF